MEPDRRPPLPWLTYAVFPNLALACVIAFAPPLSVRIAALAALASLYLRAITAFTTGDVNGDVAIGGVLATALANAYHLLVFAEPIKEYRHETDTAPPASLPLLRRFYWAWAVVNNARGVGWNYQAARIPPPPTERCWPFILRQLRRAAWLYLAIDAARYCMYRILEPMFLQDGGDALPFSAHGYAWMCIVICARWANVKWVFELQHSAAAVVCVALGLSEPRHWPAFTGSWIDAYTVRRFWGRTWHQALRRTVTPSGKALCRVFGFHSGTWQSSYTQLFVAFTMSGLMHVGGDIMMRKRDYATFWFFLSQAIAITFEDAVIGAAKRAGIRLPVPIARALGYAWTFWWGTYSLEGWFSSVFKAGLRTSRGLPFSPVGMAVRQPKVQAALSRILRVVV